MLTAGGANELAHTFRHVFSFHGTHLDMTLMYFVKLLRQFYTEMNGQVKSQQKRFKIVKRNSVVLEDIITKLTSSYSDSQELGIEKATTNGLLSDAAKKSVRNFDLRNKMKEGVHEARFDTGLLVPPLGAFRGPVLGMTGGGDSSSAFRIDFNEGMMDDDPELRAEFIRKRELEIEGRVDKILAIIEDKDFSEMYDSVGEDPLVILALNRRIHEEMSQDWSEKINDINKFMKDSQHVKNRLETNDSGVIKNTLHQVSTSLKQSGFKTAELEKKLAKEPAPDDQEMETSLFDLQNNMVKVMEAKTKAVIIKFVHDFDAFRRDMTEPKSMMTDMTAELIDSLEVNIRESVTGTLRAEYDRELRVSKDGFEKYQKLCSQLTAKNEKLTDEFESLASQAVNYKNNYEHLRQQGLDSEQKAKRLLKSLEFKVDEAWDDLEKSKKETQVLKDQLGVYCEKFGDLSKGENQKNDLLIIYRALNNHHNSVINKLEEFQASSNLRLFQEYELSKVKTLKWKKKVILLKQELQTFRESISRLASDPESDLAPLKSNLGVLDKDQWAPLLTGPQPPTFQPLDFLKILSPEISNFKNTLSDARVNIENVTNGDSSLSPKLSPP
jgi:hypothetical protein